MSNKKKKDDTNQLKQFVKIKPKLIKCCRLI